MNNNPTYPNTTTILHHTADYFPYGKVLREFVVAQERYILTGNERDYETTLDYFNARFYDSDFGRFLGVDPLAHMRSWVSPYNFVQNNPINRIDPTGALDTKYEDELGNEIVPETQDGSDDVVTITDDKMKGFMASYNGTSAEMRNSTEMNNRWKAYSGNNIKSDKLDPSTLGQNLFSMNYPGGNNPQTYPDAKGNRKWSYDAPVKNIGGIPAIGHDKSYDKLRIEGASGLLTDTRAIGADWRFVGNEFAMGRLASMTGDYSTAIKSYSLGIGLGLAATPKTILKLAQPMGTGLMQILMWDAVSKPTPSNGQ